ncbi:MAG: acylphosphatase [Syntrophobacterales bacterium]|nr:acylphosphatase [Syntrophobacterales bacterium]
MENYRNSDHDQSQQSGRESSTQRVHVFITGKVQGVFFRSETKKQALELGLKGWVRNLHDSRVEAVFEGNENNVGKMIDWCKKGPRFAHVEGVRVVEEPPANRFENFEIRY